MKAIKISFEKGLIISYYTIISAGDYACHIDF